MNEIIRKLFNDDSERFAGYWAIVDNLIENGKCITTIYATNMDFGKMKKYLTMSSNYNDSGLFLIKFDKEKMLESSEFMEQKLAEIDWIKNNINCLEIELSTLKNTLNTLEN